MDNRIKPRGATNEYYKARNAETLEVATRRQRPWSTKEARLVLDNPDNLTALALAYQIGRTVYGVRAFKARHRAKEARRAEVES